MKEKFRMLDYKPIATPSKVLQKLYFTKGKDERHYHVHAISWEPNLSYTYKDKYIMLWKSLVDIHVKSKEALFRSY